MDPEDQELLEKCKAETLIEKKTMINLLEAFAVAVKHYLCKEDGIEYQDLYPFVRFRSSPSTLSPRTFHLATNTIFHPGTEMMQRSVTYRSSTFQRTSTNNLGVLTETASRAQHLSTNGTSEGSGSRSCRYLTPVTIQSWPSASVYGTRYEGMNSQLKRDHTIKCLSTTCHLRYPFTW